MEKVLFGGVVACVIRNQLLHAHGRTGQLNTELRSSAAKAEDDARMAREVGEFCVTCVLVRSLLFFSCSLRCLN